MLIYNKIQNLLQLARSTIFFRVGSLTPPAGPQVSANLVPDAKADNSEDLKNTKRFEIVSNGGNVTLRNQSLLYVHQVH